jgi:hypothetical protein
MQVTPEAVIVKVEGLYFAPAVSASDQEMPEWDIVHTTSYSIAFLKIVQAGPWRVPFNPRQGRASGDV